MKRFRISPNGTIKSYVTNGNKLIASDYNSGYTKISQVNRVIKKVN